MVNEIINKIYETIENPEKWNTVLKEISEYCLGVSGGGASIIPLEDSLEKYRFGSNDDKNADNLYYNEWRGRAPLRNIINENKNSDLYYADDSFLTDEEIDFNPFYQDFLKNFGVRRLSNIVFKTGKGKIFVFSIQSPLGFNNLEREKIKLKMISIVSSIKLALDLSFGFELIKKTNNLFVDYLENQNYILFSLDKENKIIQKETNLDNYEKCGIIIKNNSIDFKSTENRKKFNSALELSKEQKMDKFLKLNNEFGDNIIIRITYFLKNESISSIIGNKIDKYVILTVESINKKTEYALRQFRLSPSQAKISCLLTEGLSIKEAALKMGISEGTARQMVKEIFARLEINSQNKLISFVKSVNFIC